MSEEEKYIVDVVELALDFNEDVPEGFYERYLEITANEFGGK